MTRPSPSHPAGPGAATTAPAVAPYADADLQESWPKPPSLPAARKWQILIASITLAISAAFLFVHLGHYAVWDDEALAALIGEGVWHTGDTSAVHGQNIVTYRSGLLIKNLKDRSSPPLQYYIVAPFVGLLGPHAWAVRLPMAMLGLGCVGLMLWWLHRDGADAGTWVLFAIALLGNVSFFLFFRQCRYYAPSMFLLTAVAYSYMHLKSRRGVIGLTVLCLLLFAANYMTWAAAMGMMGIDYLFWGRKRRKLSLVELAIVLVPHVVIGGLILWIWNPASIDAGEMRGPWLGDRIQLLWWTLRDLNTCEFGAGLALIAAPIVALGMKIRWLLRASIALAVGLVTIVIISPQSTTFPGTTQSDIRYLCVLIPLCIATEVLTIRSIPGRWWLWAGVPAAILLFCTNLLQGGFLLDQLMRPPLRSTVLTFVEELADPPPDPYTAAADWINANVKEGESIYTLPDFATYPLIFHAPKAIYAWQLDEKLMNDPVYKALPPIQFKNQVPPDYIILFSPMAAASTINLYNVRYDRVAVLNVMGIAAYRPELFWRRFEAMKGFDPEVAGVRIYKRQ